MEDRKHDIEVLRPEEPGSERHQATTRGLRQDAHLVAVGGDWLQLLLGAAQVFE